MWPRHNKLFGILFRTLSELWHVVALMHTCKDFKKYQHNARSHEILRQWHCSMGNPAPYCLRDLRAVNLLKAPVDNPKLSSSNRASTCSHRFSTVCGCNVFECWDMIQLLVFGDTSMSKDIQCILDDARMMGSVWNITFYVKVPIQLVWMFTLLVFHVRRK